MIVLSFFNIFLFQDDDDDDDCTAMEAERMSHYVAPMSSWTMPMMSGRSASKVRIKL